MSGSLQANKILAMKYCGITTQDFEELEVEVTIHLNTSIHWLGSQGGLNFFAPEIKRVGYWSFSGG